MLPVSHSHLPNKINSYILDISLNLTYDMIVRASKISPLFFFGLFSRLHKNVPISLQPPFLHNVNQLFLRKDVWQAFWLANLCSCFQSISDSWSWVHISLSVSRKLMHASKDVFKQWLGETTETLAFCQVFNKFSVAN